MITSRFDLLTAQQRLMLKIASVIGRVFAYRTLFDIHPIQADKPKIHDQLNTLERSDITPLETPEPELSYIFRHIITQEVAYNLMSFAQRRGLHQAIAKWLEQTYSNDLAPYYPLLAYHWNQALGEQYGDSQLEAKTLEYLEKSAVQALESFANREAIDFFGRLLALDEALGYPSTAITRASWERGLGEGYFRSGSWKDGGLHFEESLTLLDYPVPKTSGALMLGITKQNLSSSLFLQEDHR